MTTKLNDQTKWKFTDFPRCKYKIPAEHNLLTKTSDLIKLYQSYGAIPVYCSVCIPQRKLSIITRQGTLDGYILRCSDNKCLKTHYHRPEIFRGISTKFRVLHLQLYKECLGLRLFQIQTSLGITEAKATEFRKRYHHMILEGLDAIPIPNVGGTFDDPAQIDCFFPGKKRKSILYLKTNC